MRTGLVTGLLAVGLLSACSGSTAVVNEQQPVSTSSATDPASPMATASPPSESVEVVSKRQVSRLAKQVCTSRGHKDEVHQPRIVVKDFTGDGVADGVAGFSCVPQQDSEYIGFVYYWTNDESAKVNSGEVLDTLDAVLVDLVRMAESVLTIESQGMDGETTTRLRWADGRWDLASQRSKSPDPVFPVGLTAAEYLCDRPAEVLPRLRDAAADQRATEVVQTFLSAMGYDTGPIDGDYGQVTRAAVRAFQADYGLVVDGLVGPQTYGTLQAVHCSDYDTGQEAVNPTPDGGEFSVDTDQDGDGFIDPAVIGQCSYWLSDPEGYVEVAVRDYGFSADDVIAEMSRVCGSG